MNVAWHCWISGCVPYSSIHIEPSALDEILLYLSDHGGTTEEHLLVGSYSNSGCCLYGIHLICKAPWKGEEQTEFSAENSWQHGCLDWGFCHLFLFPHFAKKQCIVKLRPYRIFYVDNASTKSSWASFGESLISSDIAMPLKKNQRLRSNKNKSSRIQHWKLTLQACMWIYKSLPLK